MLKYLLDLDVKEWAAEKKLQCHTCCKEFQTPTALKRHLQRLHPNVREPAIDLPPETVSADKLDGRYMTSYLDQTIRIAGWLSNSLSLNLKNIKLADRDDTTTGLESIQSAVTVYCLALSN